MRSVISNAYGLEHITVEAVPKPVIAAGEALVRVGAISLNYVDLMVARGNFGTPLPYSLGCDAAGVVEAVGDGVTQLKIGDVVTTHFMKKWQAGGIRAEYLPFEHRSISHAFSEYIRLPEAHLVKAPANLTLEEAATLPIAALTAWEGLFNQAKLQPGQTVLLLGTGGVSIFALQFAKAAGAKVIITSGSNEKLKKAKVLEADHLINYKETPDWTKRVLEITNGEGVDTVLDVVGADLNKSIEVIKVGGVISLIGLVGGTEATVNILGMMLRPHTITVVEVASRASFEDMNRAIESLQLRPVIDRVYSLDNFAEAMQYMAAGGHFGKIVVKLEK